MSESQTFQSNNITFLELQILRIPLNKGSQIAIILAKANALDKTVAFGVW